MASSYTIQLHEIQRSILVKALESFAKRAPFELSNEKGSGQIDCETEVTEFEYLLGMLQTLPNDEADMPKCLHGFAL